MHAAEVKVKERTVKGQSTHAAEVKVKERTIKGQTTHAAEVEGDTVIAVHNRTQEKKIEGPLPTYTSFTLASSVPFLFCSVLERSRHCHEKCN